VTLGFVAGLVFGAFTTAASAAGLFGLLHAGALHLLGWWTYLTPSPQIVE